MKDFFGNMNFARWVIVVTAVVSLVLGWFVYDWSARLEEVQLELRRTPALVTEIQQKALRLDALQNLADKEGLKGEENPELYIQKVAGAQNVNIGQVSTKPSIRTTFRGVEDHLFRVDPSNKNESFPRQRIGNFLYKLEADSRKVRVTGIELTPTGRTRMGEIGPDQWTFSIELTSRQKAEG